MSPTADPPKLAADYASFLVAAHGSFDRAEVRLPKAWRRIGRNRAGKPWKAVLDAALNLSAEPQGQILEFGVYKGQSLRHLASRRPRAELHGFDSFAGFPADGRRDWGQDFAVPALPEVPGNVTLHEGYFEETVPPFVAGWGGTRPPLALVHVDCDIYSSARTVLGALSPHLRPGDVIVFDEVMNYTEFATNEFLALYLMLRETGLDFRWAVTYGAPYPLAARDGAMLDTGFQGYRDAGFFQNQAIRLAAREPGGHFDAPPASDRLVARLAEALAAMPAGAPLPSPA